MVAKARQQTGGQSPWPIWARLLRSRRWSGDRGVGDTVEHAVGLFGSARFALWHYCVFGTVANCPTCPARWNVMYPYSSQKGSGKVG